VDCLNLRAAIFAALAGSRLFTHLFDEGSREVFVFPREALLVRLEVRNALSNLFTLRIVQTYRRHPVWFDDGAWNEWFDIGAPREPHGFLHQRVKLGVPVGHFTSPQPSAYRTRPDAAIVASRPGGHRGKPMDL
jgi:hypothetical protein